MLQKNQVKSSGLIQFALDQRVLEVLPAKLQGELKEIISKNKGLDVDVEQLVLEKLAKVSVGLEDMPGNFLMQSIMLPNEMTSFLYSDPYAGFLYLFQGLTSVNKHYEKMFFDELDDKIFKVKQKTMKKAMADYEASIKRNVLEKLLSVAAVFVVKAVASIKFFRWIKKTVFRSLVLNQNFVMHCDFRTAIPQLVLNELFKDKGYATAEVFAKNLAELLNKNIEEAEKSCIMKLFWADKIFIQEFVAAENKLLILTDFFKEFKQLRDLEAVLEKRKIQTSIAKAKASMEEHLKISDKTLKNKLSILSLQFFDSMIDEAFGKQPR